MPKTIDYPRTTYLSAWEVAEVVDDTGGKCSTEACARKLNRKVSGSFKAIVGSAVKFGLLISKRDMLTTTNLFRRIKHAYDKSEEKIFHREAFLHPPLFTHICRKFRDRELPVHMFDIMLIREFGVEEINAQNVAKAFVEGARMVDILNEQNIIADIDRLAQATPRRDLSSPEMSMNRFRLEPGPATIPERETPSVYTQPANPTTQPIPRDAVSSLFGLQGDEADDESEEADDSGLALNPTPAAFSASRAVITPVSPEADRNSPQSSAAAVPASISSAPPQQATKPAHSDYSTAPTEKAPLEPAAFTSVANAAPALYTIHITGPGMDTHLDIQDAHDMDIVNALLGKIRKQLGTKN